MDASDVPNQNKGGRMSRKLANTVQLLDESSTTGISWKLERMLHINRAKRGGNKPYSAIALEGRDYLLF